MLELYQGNVSYGVLIGALPVQELLETSIGCTCGESIFANETLLFVC